MTRVTGDFLNHLQSGHTTVCRAWLLRRVDGTTFGFTDHDSDIAFDGVTFRAGTGMSANALSQTSGLSVDNTEAAGILTDDSVTEGDLKAGLFDGAQIKSWIVNWTDVSQRAVRFEGSLGEVTLESGAFRAELRGQSEALNQAQGRVYQRGCSAKLGDAACKIDLTRAAYRGEFTVVAMESRARLQLTGPSDHQAGWFAHGLVRVLNGKGAGLTGHVKSDVLRAPARFVELWGELRGAVEPGDTVELVAGCDKRMETCKAKFANFLNFRGFPHIPGEDWLIAYPSQGNGNTGGSRYR